MLYEVEEIGIDTYFWTAQQLIDMANLHCKSFEERGHYLPIDSVGKAIMYFEENGFKVQGVEK